jgi:hypothetical protein
LINNLLGLKTVFYDVVNFLGIIGIGAKKQVLQGFFVAGVIDIYKRFNIFFKLISQKSIVNSVDFFYYKVLDAVLAVIVLKKSRLDQIIAGFVPIFGPLPLFKSNISATILKLSIYTPVHQLDSGF